MYFLGLTARTPNKMDITTSRNNSLGYCKEEANIYRVNIEMLDLGKIKTLYGNIVNSYNMERTVCDIINNRSNIDIEIANKAVRACIKGENFNTSKMFEYAKKMKVYKKVKNY